MRDRFQRLPEEMSSICAQQHQRNVLSVEIVSQIFLSLHNRNPLNNNYNYVSNVNNALCTEGYQALINYRIPAPNLSSTLSSISNRPLVGAQPVVSVIARNLRIECDAIYHSLNIEQKAAYDLCCLSINRLILSDSTASVTPLLIDGMPGVGKTYFAKAITKYIIMKGTELNIMNPEKLFVVATPTAVAADQHECATTIHTSFDLGCKHQSLKRICDSQKKITVHERCTKMIVLIIDEISMVTGDLLRVTNQRYFSTFFFFFYIIIIIF